MIRLILAYAVAASLLYAVLTTLWGANLASALQLRAGVGEAGLTQLRTAFEDY